MNTRTATITRPETVPAIDVDVLLDRAPAWIGQYGVEPYDGADRDVWRAQLATVAAYRDTHDIPDAELRLPDPGTLGRHDRHARADAEQAHDGLRRTKWIRDRDGAERNTAGRITTRAEHATQRPAEPSAVPDRTTESPMMRAARAATQAASARTREGASTTDPTAISAAQHAAAKHARRNQVSPTQQAAARQAQQQQQRAETGNAALAAARSNQERQALTAAGIRPDTVRDLPQRLDGTAARHEDRDHTTVRDRSPEL